MLFDREVFAENIVAQKESKPYVVHIGSFGNVYLLDEFSTQKEAITSANSVWKMRDKGDGLGVIVGKKTENTERHVVVWMNGKRM